MAKTRFLSLKQFVVDVRKGRSNVRLMETFGLTQDQINRAFQKIIDSKAITHRELRWLAERKETTIDLRSFAADLWSGLDPQSITTKYSLNWAEYYGMIERARQIPAIPDSSIEQVTVDVRRTKRRRINARELAEDVQLGMDYENLMIKYDVTEKQLTLCLRKLIEANFLTEAEIYDRAVLFDTQLMEAQKVAQASIDELD